jgi:dienelactone hydrolase
MTRVAKEHAMKSCLLGVGMVLALLDSQAGAKLVTRTVEYKQDGTTFQGYLAYDDAVEGRRPGVLVFPEWWGLNQFPKDKAEQLAKLGYVAFAADMYGDGKVTADAAEAGKWAGGVSPQQLVQRARAALDTLRKQETVDPSQIAAIGFCFGGNAAFQLAYSGADIKAAVSFHGNLAPPSPEQAAHVKAQLLACTGAADPTVPPEKVQKFWQALEGTSVVWQINVYSGAKHSFTNPAADRYNMPPVGYNALAAERAWKAMQQLFGEVFARKERPRTRPAVR